MQSQKDLLIEMRDMLKTKELDEREALRLILVAQTSMLDKQIEMAESLAAIKKTQDKYPSLLWMATNEPKKAAAYSFGIFLILYILFAPITISDLRAALLGWIGFN